MKNCNHEYIPDIPLEEPDDVIRSAYKKIKENNTLACLSVLETYLFAKQIKFQVRLAVDFIRNQDCQACKVSGLYAQDKKDSCI